MPSEEQLRNGRFFAPISVPLKRRRQTFVMVLWLLAFPICVISFLVYTGIAFLSLLPLPILGVPMVVLWVMYVASIVLKHPYRRGRRSFRLTDSALFRRISLNFGNFFPCEIIFDGVKDSSNTDEVLRQITPGGRYLFCCHPHGLFGFGVWGAFVAHLTTGGHKFFHEHVFTKRTFDLRVHTMTVNFKIPFWRDWLLAIGFCDVDRKTLISALSAPKANEQQDEAASEAGGKKKKNQKVTTTTKGSISCLVPGGAAESVDCDTPVLTLKNRKGFVKVALETGCHLVPVYTFGETKLYRQWTSDGRVRNFLRKIQKLVGVGTPLVIGRGIFNYSFGMVPHRQKLTTVIGKPIPIPHKGKGSFTDADVDEYHAKYIAALKDLYARYKPVYDPTSRDLELK